MIISNPQVLYTNVAYAPPGKELPKIFCLERVTTNDGCTSKERRGGAGGGGGGERRVSGCQELLIINGSDLITDRRGRIQFGYIYTAQLRNGMLEINNFENISVIIVAF